MWWRVTYLLIFVKFQSPICEKRVKLKYELKFVLKKKKYLVRHPTIIIRSSNLLCSKKKRFFFGF